MLTQKAGIEKKLTKVLVDFAIEKADDDKSWDFSFDFNRIAKLLINENDIPFIETFKEKPIEDFIALKLLLKEQITLYEKTIVDTSHKVLAFIRECGLEFNDFSSSYLPKHFKNLADKKYDLKKVIIGLILIYFI